MNFRDACLKAVKQAREQGVVFYVYRTPLFWNVTPAYRPALTTSDKWLFKAYPGGRKQMSAAGNRLLDQEQTSKAGLC